MENYLVIQRSSFYLLVPVIFTLIVIIIVVIFVPASPTQAATLIVTNTNDNGVGSLRQAVADANGSETISFHNSLAGKTITLTIRILIDESITIDGSDLSSHIRVSGGSSVRVFEVDSSVTVAINHLDIINGVSIFGGGISNDGELTVLNSTLSGNHVTNIGGAIANQGTLTITNSTLSGNIAGLDGGGIYNQDTLIVNSSTFDGNHADSGAGIYNTGSGTIMVSNSTFAHNDADSSGSGILNNGGTLTVSNATFSDNSAVSSGGGIYNSIGTLHLKNSILANTSGGANDCFSTNTLATNTNNLIENGICGGIALSDDPLLGSLADNGGSTETMVLGVGSPAIDTGDDPTCEPTDQREINRPQGDHCDIGALELFQPIVNSSEDPGDGACNTSQCTLREAVASVESGGAIKFDLSLAGEMITVTTPISVEKYMTIDGTGLNPHIQVSGGDGVRVFAVIGGVTASFVHLDIIDGSSVSGGAIDIDDSIVHVSNTTFVGNVATQDGGAIHGTGVLSITNSSFMSNTTGDDGGGIYFNGPMTVTNSIFQDNQAGGNGGSLMNEENLMIATTSFYSNTALGYGGAVNNDFEDLIISNSTFANNNATNNGGAVNNYQGNVRVNGSTFSTNQTDQYGGAICNSYGTITVTNSTLFSNNSTFAGGGIDNWEGQVIVSNSTLSANSASSAGGIYNSTNGSLRIRNSILSDSSSGGDCVNDGTITVNIKNLIEDGTCTPALSGDPILEPLADRGGWTLTMAPKTGSPVIDAGEDISCEAADQRGLQRPYGNHCDIGAYESVSYLIVNSTNDPGDGICNISECSLREATRSVFDGGTITFDPSLSGGSIKLYDGDIDLLRNLTIDGSGLYQQIKINAQSNSRVFTVNQGVAVSMEKLKIFNGREDYGGAIYNDIGNVTISSLEFNSNLAEEGGVIYNNQGILNISDSTFNGNIANFRGGGIRNKGALTVTNSTFELNEVLGGEGGGIYSSVNLTVHDSTFLGNTALSSGGGIFGKGEMTISNSAFINNYSAGKGGGIGNEGNLMLSNSTIYMNEADFGGGLANIFGNSTISNSTIYGNRAEELGGGVYSYNALTSHIFNLKNTIIADSTHGVDCYTDVAMATNINNLIEDGSCSPLLTGDPHLGPLGYYGGSTFTMPLDLSSPALDAGDDSTCEPTDQRGVIRPQGPHCDISAYEMEYPTVFLPLVLK